MVRLTELDLKIGCFEVGQIPSATGCERTWWQVRNTLTGVEHRTFGTKAEVSEQLQIQSAIWERKQLEKDKKVKRPKGHAWRAAIVNETRDAARKAG